MQFEFLKNLQLAEVSEEKSSGRTPAADRNPAKDFMGIRVHKSGAIYPSEALVKALDLEYPTVTYNTQTKKGKDGAEDTVKKG